MDGRSEYQKWVSYNSHPEEIVRDLQSIRDNDAEIEERFGRDLDFGTGGLRGILGAGLNRMNIHTVRKASWALAQYVLRQGAEAAKKGIVIGYDCRHGSEEFAEAAGLIMAAVGVKAYVSPYLCPTPELSFAVRQLGAAAGVMITASHNPPEYNGYKVYGPDGGQLLPDEAKQIREIMAENQNVFDLPAISLDVALQAGTFGWVSADIRKLYIETVVREVGSANVSERNRDALRIVYTPLHGTGNVPIRQVLTDAGYKNVFVVEQQAAPDGDFPTVKSPNPEEPEALQMAIRHATETGADIVLGTDPDADRVGIAVRDAQGEYRLLTGNQVGALLVDFILATRKENGTLPENGIVFKTIVTSELGQAIAASYGISTEDTLTGFKYIGERISRYEQTGEHSFLFGYEESYGYLISPIVRDKDAVQTVLAIVEMAAHHRAQGKTLLDVLQSLFERFGFYHETLLSVTLPGADGLTKMSRVIHTLREQPLNVPGFRMTAVEDYSTGNRTEFDENGMKMRERRLQLPVSDVLKYFYDDGSWIAVRPSGTEPKLKAYIAVRGENQESCFKKVQQMREAVQARVL